MKQCILIYFGLVRINTFYPLIKHLSKEFDVVVLTNIKKNEHLDLSNLKSTAHKVYFVDEDWIYKILLKMQEILSKFVSLSIIQILLKYVFISFYARAYKITARLHKIYDFKVFMPYDDRTHRDVIGSIAFAKKNKIPIILPYIYLSGYYVSPMYHRAKYWEKSNLCLYQNYIFKKFENYGVQKYKEHFYFSAFVLSAQYSYHKIISKNPYFTGCGTCDIVVLDSNLTKEYYSKVKEFDMSKARILGDVTHDNLYEAYKNKDQIKAKFKEKYNLDNRKIVVFAAIQLFEHGMTKTLQESLDENEFIIENILKNDVQLIISLHPFMKKQDYVCLQEKFDCIIADESLMEFLPIADIFIHAGSSTAIWALLCGIKTLNLWFWGNEGKELFSKYETMRDIYDKNLLSQTIYNLMQTDIDFSPDWKKLSRNEVFDGNTKQRYLELFKDLASK